MECQLELNRANCTCTYEPCERKGKCCDCLTYHWKQGQLPGCLFPSNVEKTYDRSLKKFLETYSSRLAKG